MFYEFNRNAAAAKDAAAVITACGELVEIVKLEVLSLDLKAHLFKSLEVHNFQMQLRLSSTPLCSSTFKKMVEELSSCSSAIALVTPATAAVIASPSLFDLDATWSSVMTAQRCFRYLGDKIAASDPEVRNQHELSL